MNCRKRKRRSGHGYLPVSFLHDVFGQEHLYADENRHIGREFLKKYHLPFPEQCKDQLAAFYCPAFRQHHLQFYETAD